MKYALFLRNVDECIGDGRINSTIHNELLGPSDIIFGALGCFSSVFRQINGMYEELIICVAIIGFWLNTKFFVEFLKGVNSAEKWELVYKNYTKLRSYGRLTNDVFSQLFLAYTGTSLFYYSINLDKFLISSDIMVRLKYCVYYTNLFCIFILASDINKQVSKILRKHKYFKLTRIRKP